MHFLGILLGVPPTARCWASAGGQQGGGGPQGSHMSTGIASRHVGRTDRLVQRLSRAGEIGVGGGRQVIRVGVGFGSVSSFCGPQSTQLMSCQLPSDQSKARSKTPPEAPVAGLPSPASTRQISRSSSRSSALGLGPEVLLQRRRRSRSLPVHPRSSTKDRSPPSARSPRAPSTIGRATGTVRDLRSGSRRSIPCGPQPGRRTVSSLAPLCIRTLVRYLNATPAPR